jgi:hypothetical protein
MKQPYWLVFLVGLDRLGAAVFFNRPDLTISTLCWIVRYAASDIRAATALKSLNLYQWQRAILGWLGDGLEWLQPGHCIQARAFDLWTAQSITGLLT